MENSIQKMFFFLLKPSLTGSLIFSILERERERERFTTSNLWYINYHYYSGWYIHMHACRLSHFHLIKFANLTKHEVADQMFSFSWAKLGNWLLHTMRDSLTYTWIHTTGGRVHRRLTKSLLIVASVFTSESFHNKSGKREQTRGARTPISGSGNVSLIFHQIPRMSRERCDPSSPWHDKSIIMLLGGCATLVQTGYISLATV